MLACLKKDYYTILGYCRYLLFVIVLFTLLPYLSGDTKMGFYAIYPRLFAGMIPLTVYTYDEREHWCSTCATLPISRRTYVLSKYVLGLILTAVIVALALVLNLIFTAVNGVSVSVSPGLSVAMSLAAPALTMPFVFLFGAEKGRIIYLIGVGAASALSVMAMNEVPSLSVGSDVSLLLGAMVLYAVSAVLSVAFYGKREL